MAKTNRKVDTIMADDQEFVRSKLAWLGDWISENSQLKNRAEIRRLLHELVDISA